MSGEGGEEGRGRGAWEQEGIRSLKSDYSVRREWLENMFMYIPYMY